MTLLKTFRLPYLFFGLGLLFTAGCGPLFDIRKAMYDQPKYEPLEATDFFGDRRSARPLVAGTVAQGHLQLDDHLYLGIEEEDGNYRQAQTYPFEITAEDLDRGQEMYNIHCSVCHGKSGHGNGMVVQRGYKTAPSYHRDALRKAPPGYFYAVILNGFNEMQPYAHQVPVEDRWRIVAYIKTLQRSQFAQEEDLETIQQFMDQVPPTPSSEHSATEHTNEH
ncbi:cytochrome c [Kiritimatiellaeota bacterium B1221]|nr:cytochrome c [Kiritimatiellaeota bacterium B1221]